MSIQPHSMTAAAVSNPSRRASERVAGSGLRGRGNP